MTQPLDKRAPATPFLTSYFGGGLIDKGECYVVERFRSMSSGLPPAPDLSPRSPHLRQH